MARIEPVGHPATVRRRAVPERPSGTDLVVVAAPAPGDGRTAGPSQGPAGARSGDARPRAAFVAQLIVCADPALRPSRAERAGRAARAYAATALQVA